MEVSFLKSAALPEQFPPSDRPEIAFAGRSNVGKSSLINRLINSRNIARTSSRPGRTRSINFFSVGKNLHLTDLPGYGYAGVPLNVRQSWKKLVETYLKKRPNLKAVVVIIDIRRKVAEGDLDLLTWLKVFQIKPIIVLTKIDKLSKSQARRQFDLFSKELIKEGFGPPIAFSAKTGQGKQELWKKINEIV
ncbi:MAG: YihA family ribosome biogenesis GTP-binding protein [Deltaproteobacteria bacterium]|nr:YihA family ribosome biogenesis GTP-binding protein [Deltaproteobacteria bacterium]